MTARRIDSLTSIGVDINNRSVLIDGPVDEDMLRNCWTALAALGPGKPITIFLSSPGGELDVGFAIYDLLRAFENTLNIVVIGNASSSASVILQAADVRLITPNSFIMVHKGTISVSGEDTEENTARWTTHYKKYGEKMLSMYAEKMKLTLPQIKKLLTHDKIYTGQEAVDVGLCDAIWTKT